MVFFFFKALTTMVFQAKASNGEALVAINPNYGDTATISSTCATGVKEICSGYKGNSQGVAPDKISTGQSNYCKYTSVPPC